MDKLKLVRNFTNVKLLTNLFLISSLAAMLFSCAANTGASSSNRGVKEITIRIKSRMYLNFQEDHTVRINEKFHIADTDYEAVVVEFLSDFAIDTTIHKAFSRSDTLNNPAAKVLIIKDNEKKEEIWAFRPGVMMHYSPRSFIGMELIDYKTSKRYKIPAIKKIEKLNE